MKITPNLIAPQIVATVSNNIATVAPRVRVGLSTDVQGADLQALQRFNETLPQPSLKSRRVAGKKLTVEETLAEGETVVDAPEMLLAQAEAAAAGEAAGAAGAGGAEAAGAAGAGAEAAGAAAAVGGVSPLAFSPLLGVAGGGGGGEVNTPPVLTINPRGQLSVNAADTTDLVAGAKATDVNAGQKLTYHFVDLESNVKSSSVSVKSGGTYSIDKDTGVISFTAEPGSLALLCQEDDLYVVAFDGFAYSVPQHFTVERVLDFETPQQEGNLVYTPDSLTAYSEDAHWALSPGLQLLDMSDKALYPELDLEGGTRPQFIAPLELDKLHFSRQDTRMTEGVEEPANDLLVCFEVNNEADVDAGIKGSIRIEGHFAEADFTTESRLEYVHFQKGTSFHGYNLGEALPQDLVQVTVNEEPVEGYYASFPEEETPFPEDGVYQVMTGLNGTACKDLISSSSIGGQTLDGLGGNDLLFANGEGDVAIGGSGSDLIVLADDSECTQQTVTFSAAVDNGEDWVVNFDHHLDKIRLERSDVNGADAPRLSDASLNEGLDGSWTLSTLEGSAPGNIISTKSDWAGNTSLLLATPTEGEPSMSDAEAFFMLLENKDETVLYHMADSNKDNVIDLNEMTLMAHFSSAHLTQSNFEFMPTIVA